MQRNISEPLCDTKSKADFDKRPIGVVWIEDRVQPVEHFIYAYISWAISKYKKDKKHRML